MSLLCHCPALPDISCCFSLSPGSRNGARAVRWVTAELGPLLWNSFWSAGKNRAGRHSNQMNWGWRKPKGTAQDACRNLFPSAGSRWLPVWKPKSSSPGPVYELHSQMTGTCFTLCCWDRHEETWDRGEREQEVLTWKRHFHSALILKDSWTLSVFRKNVLFSHFCVFHILKFMTVMLFQCTKDF